MNLKYHTKVLYDIPGNIRGYALVVGISSNTKSGIIYILQANKIISDNYPYTTFICHENFISKL